MTFEIAFDSDIGPAASVVRMTDPSAVATVNAASPASNRRRGDSFASVDFAIPNRSVNFCGESFAASNVTSSMPIW